MKKVLVTGGLGFIGSHFVEKMLNDIPDHIQQNPDQIIPDFDKVIQAWLPTLNLSGTTDNNVTKQKNQG